MSGRTQAIGAGIVMSTNERVEGPAAVRDDRPPDRGPLDIAATWPDGDSPWSERCLSRAVWAFVVLGVILRVVRYLLNFPLWGDEAFVATNFIARGYRDLLGPLDYGQICPVLFLWIELTAVKLLGYSEWSLRLFPIACGAASLFLFRHVAGRVVRGVPLLLAVGIFAVSFHPIRHSAEVKPYASDLLVALVLLAPALEWWRSPSRAGWLWVLVAVVPMALALSHPAVFVAGGIVLGLAVPAWKTGRPGVRIPFALYCLSLGATFLLLFLAITCEEGRGVMGALRDYWADSFPPLDDLRKLLRWLVVIHTGTMFAYPGGGQDGLSTPTFVCFAAAAFVLWRHGRRAVVIALLGPFALALLAAAVRRYPYGGEARQMQFVAPAICILAGLGSASLLRVFPRPNVQVRVAFAGVLCLTLGGLASMAQDVAHPYRYESDHQRREFARRFWPAQAKEAEVACLRRDFGIVDPGFPNYRAALYLCNQQIYCPRRRRAGGPCWGAISPARPLRCVLHPEIRPDYPDVVAWMARMSSRYDLRKIEGIDIDLSRAKFGPKVERLLIFEYAPKPSGLAATPATPMVRR